MKSTTPTVAYHVRRLDSAELRALVADLWAARGFPETREEDVTVDRGIRGVEIRVRERTGPNAAVPSPDGDGPDEHSVDARELAEVLRYAVEPAVTKRICERHLDAPPERLRPSPTTRLRRRAAGIKRASPPTPLVAITLVALGAILLAGLPADPGSVGESPAAETTTQDRSSATDRGSVTIATGYPAPPVGGFDFEVESTGEPGGDRLGSGADAARSCRPSELLRVDDPGADSNRLYYCPSEDA